MFGLKNMIIELKNHDRSVCGLGGLVLVVQGVCLSECVYVYDLKIVCYPQSLYMCLPSNFLFFICVEKCKFLTLICASA